MSRARSLRSGHLPVQPTTTEDMETPPHTLRGSHTTLRRHQVVRKSVPVKVGCCGKRYVANMTQERAGNHTRLLRRLRTDGCKRGVAQIAGLRCHDRACRMGGGALTDVMAGWSD